MTDEEKFHEFSKELDQLPRPKYVYELDYGVSNGHGPDSVTQVGVQHFYGLKHGRHYPFCERGYLLTEEVGVMVNFNMTTFGFQRDLETPYPKMRRYLDRVDKIAEKIGYDAHAPWSNLHIFGIFFYRPLQVQLL